MRQNNDNPRISQRESNRAYNGNPAFNWTSIRAVVDLEALGERTIWIDCDVIQADGGTRTASITGAFVAMILAFAKLYEAEKAIKKFPMTDYLAATSRRNIRRYQVLF